MTIGSETYRFLRKVLILEVIMALGLRGSLDLTASSSSVRDGLAWFFCS